MYEQILYEVEDPVATLTLNRPDRLNAWTGRMGTEVKHALAEWLESAYRVLPSEPGPKRRSLRP
jgi:enoyl-CoA hydratase/carnithine racemase